MFTCDNLSYYSKALSECGEPIDNLTMFSEVKASVVRKKCEKTLCRINTKTAKRGLKKNKIAERLWSKTSSMFINILFRTTCFVFITTNRLNLIDNIFFT